MSTPHWISATNVTAREYGKGLDYPPAVTIVLATIITAGCVLAVVGYFAIKFSWWRQDHKKRSRAPTSPDDRRLGDDG